VFAWFEQDRHVAMQSLNSGRKPGRPIGGDAAVRNVLLMRARELFLRHGFHDVSTRRIANEAGTTSATIHYHFGDKLGLYRVMVESAVQPFIEDVERLTSGEGAETPDLEALIRAYMTMVAENPWFPMLLVREAFARGGPLRTEFVERFAGRVAPALAVVLRREREQGRVRPDVDPTSAAVSLLGLCVFPFLSLPITGPLLGFRPEGDELHRFIRHTAQLFREGVATRPDRDSAFSTDLRGNGP
jgi:AcrR family transcriptional regulator